ncbi:hypothetical protein PV708_02515 [Streptomyces sp. ME02-6977A]|uniref:hypothetical protein n=1 Tax=unclassified Streptomyces TaxID=2593676 RepID=UPI001B3824A5|nr:MULTISPECIES: hypothetical protein [unclassified Streptomyces]MBQ0949211.1 hypothetical protein [Streptomyces sp. RK76]MDX3405121.1 hypothetical protein [Streptomyces sp. ME02-6977A]
MSDQRVQIGTVYVDSGTVFVGDPCYTATGDASNHIKTWSDWCDKHSWNGENRNVVEPAGPGLGLSIPTLYGDGAWPVFAELEGERIARVIIDFDPECDEDDEDE